jgi:hypothetical protein
MAAWFAGRDTVSNQNEGTDWLKKLAIEAARDVLYLLDHHHEIGQSQFGEQMHLPNAVQRASELRTTLREARKSLGLNPDPDSGETL